MNLPLRQAKFSLFVASLAAGLLLVLLLGTTASYAQTPIGTEQTGGNADTAPQPATGGTTITGTGTLSGTKPITNTVATTPTRDPNLPGNELTGIVPEAGPSDVVPPAEDLSSPGAGTPSVPPPSAAIPYTQDNGPLGSWPVTIVLILIVIGVVWGAYQFLRRPAASEADAAQLASTTTYPEDNQQIAPLTNEAETVVSSEDAATEVMPSTNALVDNSTAEAATVATPVVAAAAAPLTSATPPVAQPLDLPDELLPYLETLSRADEQLEYVLDRSYITVGRARTNDIVIDNTFVGWQTVSAYHADLRYQNGHFVVVDKQSDNGTFVNRVRTGNNVLEDGMAITFGKVEFIYRQPKAS